MKLSSKKSKILTGIVLVLLVLVLLNVFQKEVRSFFYWFSAPIQKILWPAGEWSSDFLTGLLSQRCLKDKLDELSSKNQELIVEIENLKNLEQENEILRQALGLELEKDFKLSLAQVIGRDISQDYILINKGSRDGVLKRMPVITEQKVLVGRIGEVYENFSKVMLITDKKSSFDAEFGIVRGQGNLRLLFDLIPKEKEIAQGDIVFTSALAGIFPQGLLVGEIKNIKKDDLESFQQAEIKPGFDISQAKKVFIILE